MYHETLKLAYQRLISIEFYTEYCQYSLYTLLIFTIFLQITLSITILNMITDYLYSEYHSH